MQLPWPRKRKASKQTICSQRVKTFGHGTTQATNALIERTGAVTGLITTRGFGDTIGLQRLMGFTVGMPSDQLGWYSRRRYPDPIIPREFRARGRRARRLCRTHSCSRSMKTGVRKAVDDLSARGARHSR